MRNSWGGYWGEGGYMRMRYGCSRIGYGACFIDYRPLYVTPGDTLGPAPMTVSFTGSAPGATIDSCRWDFGDGTSECETNPVHEYVQPGHHSVDLTLYTTEGEWGKSFPGRISVYADTMGMTSVLAEPGERVKVDVYARNYLPLGEIQIPLSYAGALNLVYDSFSTVGLRTEYLDDQRTINYDPFNKRTVILLKTGTGGDDPMVAEGAGPIVSLHFTVPSSAARGENPVELTAYGLFTPRFVTYAGEYHPEEIKGSVQLAGCCVDTRGNVQLEPSCDLSDQSVDVGDLTALIDHLFISFTPVCCLDEADIAPVVFPDGSVDVGDLTALIDHLFITFTPLTSCW